MNTVGKANSSACECVYTQSCGYTLIMLCCTRTAYVYIYKHTCISCSIHKRKRRLSHDHKINTLIIGVTWLKDLGGGGKEFRPWYLELQFITKQSSWKERKISLNQPLIYIYIYIHLLSPLTYSLHGAQSFLRSQPVLG